MKVKTPVLIIKRSTGEEKEEQVFGRGLLDWLYQTSPGRLLTDRILSRRFFSQLYGLYQSSPFTWSRRRIESFVRDYGIAMEEFEAGPYRSFNDFFIRRFKPTARTFVGRKNEMPALAEGRYLGYLKTGDNQTLPVKGIPLSPTSLLGGKDKARPFRDGPCLIARLCPTDYHRFHYPDDGTTLEEYRIPGRLHSVNPIALQARPEIFLNNERHVSILKTENFGRLATVEVGALCVGKIVQTHPADQPFSRGMEKGTFLFGGSTIVLFGERGAWRPDQDLLTWTGRGREVFVRLGERVASILIDCNETICMM